MKDNNIAGPSSWSPGLTCWSIELIHPCARLLGQGEEENSFS